MRSFLAILSAWALSLALSSPVSAAAHGSLAVAPPAHCTAAVSAPSIVLSVDNGCAATYTATMPGGVSPGASFTPSFQDTNFVYNHATTGQVANPNSNPSQYAADVLTYTTFAHYDLANRPYWDYPIGSANPSTLRGIWRFNSDFPADNCTYNLAGTGALHTTYPYTNFNYVYCFWQTSSVANYDHLQGYDFSNCDASGVDATGQCTVLLYLQENLLGAGQIDVRGYNLYWKCTATCLASSGINYITLKGYLNFECWWCAVIDWTTNIDTAAKPAGTFHEVISDIRNQRDTLTAQSYNQFIKWKYSWIDGLAHDPMQSGGTSAAPDIDDSYSVDNGAGLDSNAHGEWDEMGGPFVNGTIVHDYTGTMWLQPSANFFIELTSPQYGPGADNGNRYHIIEKHVFNVFNKVYGTGCSGHPPYSAANPCLSGTGSIFCADDGLMSPGGNAAVDLDLGDNIIDDNQCVGVYNNAQGPSGLGGFGSATVNINNDGTNSWLDISGYRPLTDHAFPTQLMDPKSNFVFRSGAPVGWHNAWGTTLTDGTLPSTLNEQASFVGTWSNGAGGSGTLLTITTPASGLSLYTPPNGNCTGAPNTSGTDGCINFVNAGNGYATGSVLGYAVSDNCSGVMPCASWNMSSAQNFSGAALRVDNLHPLTDPKPCVVGYNSNCGRIYFKGVLEPITNGVTGMAFCASVRTLNITGTSIIVQPGALGTYASPHIVTYSDLTPAASTDQPCPGLNRTN